MTKFTIPDKKITSLVNFSQENLDSNISVVSQTMDGIILLPLSTLHSPEWNARKYVDEAALQALAADMKKNGQLAPILVRPLQENHYEIISGNRRYQAAKILAWESLKAMVLTVDDNTAYQMGLADNIERQDLNPFEETLAYLFLLQNALFPDLSSNEASEKISALLKKYWSEYNENKSHGLQGSATESQILAVFSGSIQWQTFYQHRLPLLKLPQDIQTALKEGKIAYSKARLLSKIKDAKQRKTLLAEAIKDNLSLSVLKQRLQSLAITTETNPTANDQQVQVLWKSVGKKLKKLPATSAEQEKILVLLQEIAELLDAE